MELSGDIEFRREPAPVPYRAALDAMTARNAAIGEGSARELVWLLEHPPVYTAGTSAAAAELLDPRFEVVVAGRGGRYTYHGPGQAVGYVLLDLKRRARDARGFVDGLEGWVIATLADFGVEGFRREGRIGIWTHDIDGARGEDRRHRRAHPPLGDDARLRGEHRARPFALRRDRSVRDQRVRCHEPGEAGQGRDSRPMGRSTAMPCRNLPGRARSTLPHPDHRGGMMRLIVLVAATLALAGCNRNAGGNGETDSAVAVLPGSASDAMIHYDALRSQPPHATETAGSSGHSATGRSAEAADAGAAASAAAEPAPVVAPSIAAPPPPAAPQD